MWEAANYSDPYFISIVRGQSVYTIDILYTITDLLDCGLTLP